MSNVYDLRRRKVETISEMVNEIHRQFDHALSSEKKAYSSRIYAGQLLNALRKRIEAGEEGDGVKWWEWYGIKFVRSRRDAERVMKMARAENPEVAAEEERAKAREGMQAGRSAFPDEGADDIPLFDYCSRPEQTLLVAGCEENTTTNVSRSARSCDKPSVAEDVVDHAFRLVAPLLAKMDEQQRDRFLALITEVRYEKQGKASGNDSFQGHRH